MGHLTTAMEQGAPIDIADLNITEAMMGNVAKVIWRPPIASDVSRLGPIKTELDLIDYDVDFGRIRLIVSRLKLEHGINEEGILQWKGGDWSQYVKMTGIESEATVTYENDFGNSGRYTPTTFSGDKFKPMVGQFKPKTSSEVGIFKTWLIIVTCETFM